MPRLVHHALAALIPTVVLAVTSPAPATLEAAPVSVADCTAEVATYKGGGDVNDAASFACEKGKN